MAKSALRHYVLSDLGEGETLACKGCDCKEWFSSATAWIHSLTRLTEKANSGRDRACDQSPGEEGCSKYCGLCHKAMDGLVI